ncbi:RraA family protein [Streptomyces xantholiticus]
MSCWGGILSLGASIRGVRGVVADGVCRDVAEARELGFPVFSRGSIPATARAGCSSAPPASRSASPGSRSNRVTSSSPTRPASPSSRGAEPRKWYGSPPRSSPGSAPSRTRCARARPSPGPCPTPASPERRSRSDE